ncbi:MAG: reverse transcriptase family protein [Pseudomonadota bacterium]
MALASRLEASRWSGEAIERLIARHLPAPFQRHAGPLARDLMGAFPLRYAPDAARLMPALLAWPQLDRLVKHCEKTGLWPTPLLAPPRMLPVPPFDHFDLPVLETIGELADWLLLTPEQLDALADRTGWREAQPLPPIRNYFYRISAKAGGGVRLIEAPKPRLKAVQRVIQRGILDRIPPHKDSFGFTKGRSVIGAAQRHAGEEIVIAFDLQRYFTSITYGRVHALFRHFGYPASVAHALSALCTLATPARIRAQLPYHQRQALKVPHLPQGAPSSPALANLLTYTLDRRLSALARALGAQYARYADDMVFSGDAMIRAPLLRAVPQIVRDEGFRLNAAKTRVMTRAQRQLVLGLVVNERVTVPRKEIDRLRATIHGGAWQRDPAALASLLGQIGWVAQVNPARGAKLYAQLEHTAGQ